MSLLSIAIIMKNEEQVAERCLTCASKLGDEIILVDTGSTDATKTIASRFPKVQVFDSAFFNKDTHFSDFEFSRAKNEAVRRCTCDHILWFDADDFVDDENIAKIRKIVETEKEACLYSFDVVSGTMRFEHCRMFRNRVGILFDEGHACHEFLDSNGHPLVTRRDIVIRHLPEHKKISSCKRNLAILEKDYRVRGRDDQRTLFYLANEYKEDGQNDKAIRFFDMYLEKSQWREERYFARLYKARCLFRSGMIDESRDELCRAMAEDFRFAESFCFMGDIAYEKKEFETAIMWFRMAMATSYPKDSRLFINSSFYSEYPVKRIGECIAAKEQSCDGSQGEKSVDTKETTGRRHGKFFLPLDRGLSMMAVTALANCVSAEKADIDVVAKDSWQRSLVSKFKGLKIGEGDAKELFLPDDLKGRHIAEWYVLSAGFMLPCMGVLRIANEGKRENRFVIVTEKIILPDAVQTMIGNAGKEIRLIAENEEFDSALMGFKDALVFIGKAGWRQHLAEWTRVPAFVFHRGGDPTEFGWEDHENRKTGDFSGIEDFIKRSLP